MGLLPPNFAPIDLKPRIWTFQTGAIDPRGGSSEKYREQKVLLFLGGFVPIFLPHTPFFDLDPPRQTTDLRLVENSTKKNQVHNCNQKSARGKRNFTD